MERFCQKEMTQAHQPSNPEYIPSQVHKGICLRIFTEPCWLLQIKEETQYPSPGMAKYPLCTPWVWSQRQDSWVGFTFSNTEVAQKHNASFFQQKIEWYLWHNTTYILKTYSKQDTQDTKQFKIHIHDKNCKNVTLSTLKEILSGKRTALEIGEQVGKQNETKERLVGLPWWFSH